MNNLTKQEKLDILHGKRQLSDLVKSRAFYINNISKILELEEQVDNGQFTDAPEFVEKDGIIYSLAGFEDKIPADIEEVLEILSNHDMIILHKAEILEVVREVLK